MTSLCDITNGFPQWFPLSIYFLMTPLFLRKYIKWRWVCNCPNEAWKIERLTCCIKASWVVLGFQVLCFVCKTSLCVPHSLLCTTRFIKVTKRSILSNSDHIWWNNQNGCPINVLKLTKLLWVNFKCISNTFLPLLQNDDVLSHSEKGCIKDSTLLKLGLMLTDILLMEINWKFFPDSNVTKSLTFSFR